MARKRDKTKNLEPGEHEGREKIGKLWVKKHPSGSATIFGKGIRDRGIYAPPREYVIRRAKREYKSDGALTPTTATYVQNWGLLNPGNQHRTVESGLSILGISHSHPQAVKLAEADKAFRKFWKSHDVRSHDKKRKIRVSEKLPKIQDFINQHREVYNWIMNHGGMYKFMEQRHPGLYYKLSRRIGPESLDLDELRREVVSLINSGTPLNEKYLLKSQEPNEKKVAREIKTILRNRFDFSSSSVYRPKTKYIPPQVKTFMDVIAYLSGIPKEKLISEGRSARDCGRLAEKFVECYVLWAIRTNHDPLKLNLPGTSRVFFREHPEEREDEEAEETLIEEPDFKVDVNFNNHGTAYRYGKKEKGIADGRIGDTALEVKVGTREFTEKYTQELLRKYSHGAVWEDGRYMDGSTFIFYQEPKFYAKVLPQIENAGIRVIGFKEFHSAFASLLEKIDKSSNILENLEPQINPATLLNGHSKLNLERRMSLFCRDGFSHERKWYKDMLKSLITEALQ